MSGEADEDTMSAWGSLGGGGGGLGSPSELGPPLSLRRRSSFGMHMSSFSEDPLHEHPVDGATLESELAGVGRGGDQGDDDLGTFGGVVNRAKEVGPGGGRDAPTADETGQSSTNGNDTGELHGAQDKGSAAVTAGPKEEKGQGLAGMVPKEPKDAAVREPVADGNGSNSLTNVLADSSEERRSKALADTEGINTLQPRRRSNQDDQSDGFNSKANSARSGEDEADAGRGMPNVDSSVDGAGVNGEERDGRGEGSEYPLVALTAEESVASGGSDARYVRGASINQCA